MIVIWKRPDNSYYFREVKGYYRNYEIGFKNQYNHEVVLIIYPKLKKISIKEKFKCSLIRYIKNL